MKVGRIICQMVFLVFDTKKLWLAPWIRIFFENWNYHRCGKWRHTNMQWTKDGNASVTTLILGSWPRQGGCKVAGQEGGPWVSSHALESAKSARSVREWTLTLPSELPLWELEFKWTPKFLERNFRGQNPLVQRVLYIIGKLLKRKCLKWARMTHLDIWNTSYGQKKGWESNYQFDSRPLKVKNWPDFLALRWRATYRWKDLHKGYNFV
jgi:hypothetical protein